MNRELQYKDDRKSFSLLQLSHISVWIYDSFGKNVLCLMFARIREIHKLFKPNFRIFYAKSQPHILMTLVNSARSQIKINHPLSCGNGKSIFCVLKKTNLRLQHQVELVFQVMILKRKQQTSPKFYICKLHGKVMFL